MAEDAPRSYRVYPPGDGPAKAPRHILDEDVFLVDSAGNRTPLPGHPIPRWEPAPPRIEGLTFVAELPKCGRIVSMVEHQGVLMVATETGVWALHEGSFHPVRFAEAQQR